MKLHARLAVGLLPFAAIWIAAVPPAQAIPTWSITSITYNFTVFSTGTPPEIGQQTLTGSNATPTVRTESGTSSTVIGSFSGSFVEFSNTNLLAVGQKTPENIDATERAAAEAVIDAAVTSLGISTNPGLLLSTVLKNLLPLGESRVFADGDLEINGSVSAGINESIIGFKAQSDGKLFSAGLFADAILGDGIPANEVDLTFDAKDFAYQGAGISFTGTDYRFDPVGGGLTDYQGSASFSFSKRGSVAFDVKHSFGAEIGLLANSDDFPIAGASLDDLKLSVTTTIPEPSSLLIFAFGFAGVGLLSYTRCVRSPGTRRAKSASGHQEA